MLGLELAELEGSGLVPHFVAQRAERAVLAEILVGRMRIHLVELGGDASDERLFRVVGVELLVLLPGLGLRVLDEGETILRVECQLAVVLGGLAEQPAALHSSRMMSSWKPCSLASAVFLPPSGLAGAGLCSWLLRCLSLAGALQLLGAPDCLLEVNFNGSREGGALFGEAYC